MSGSGITATSEMQSCWLDKIAARILPIFEFLGPVFSYFLYLTCHVVRSFAFLTKGSVKDAARDGPCAHGNW